MAHLPDELVREILLRVTPDDPACLLRAAVVCKCWRRMLADPDFRCRHRELHPTPHVGGFLRILSNAIPYSSRLEFIDPTFRRPAARDLPGWLALDCRHGRALFATPAPGGSFPVALDFIVWNPLTDERRRLPQPSPRPTAPPTGRSTDRPHFNAAVLCAATAEGCDHRGCHRGPFRVVFLFSTSTRTCALVYSSETDDWSYLTSTPGHNLYSVDNMPSPSVLVGDTLYFRGSGNFHAFEYQVTTHRLSAIYRPQSASLMATAAGEFHFTTLLEDPLSLCLWSAEKVPDGFEQWVQARAFNLEMLLPKDTLMPRFNVTGSVEGADIIFVIVYKYAHHRGDVYMVHLDSGKITKVFEGYSYVFPYTSFCIPGI